MVKGVQEGKRLSATSCEGFTVQMVLFPLQIVYPALSSPALVNFGVLLELAREPFRL